MRPATVICTIMLVAAPAVGFAQDKSYPDFGSIAKTPGPASGAVPAVPKNIPGTTNTEKDGSRPRGGDTPYPDLGAVKKTGPSVPAIAAAPMREGFRPQDIPEQEHRRCEDDRERDRGEGAREQACDEPRAGCDHDCDHRAQYREGSCDRREERW
jgi:hypothetical protein